MTKSARIRWPDSAEVGKVAPGHYVVEGMTVKKVAFPRSTKRGRRAMTTDWRWVVEGDTTNRFESLTDAIEALTDGWLPVRRPD